MCVYQKTDLEFRPRGGKVRELQQDRMLLAAAKVTSQVLMETEERC